jgi:hypothetical protein
MAEVSYNPDSGAMPHVLLLDNNEYDQLCALIHTQVIHWEANGGRPYFYLDELAHKLHEVPDKMT